MSERQQEALARIEAALPNIPEHKLEYLQGYMDCMDDMNRKAEAAKEEKEEEETT